MAILSSKRTDRLGRIIIDSDLLIEIFEKINGEFIKEKIEILSITYDPDKRNYFADCYSEKFPKVAMGAAIPIVHELYPRRNITPTEAFRRSRRISKIIDESQIVKRVIPKKKRINEKSNS